MTLLKFPLDGTSGTTATTANTGAYSIQTGTGSTQTFQSGAAFQGVTGIRCVSNGTSKSEISYPLNATASQAAFNAAIRIPASFPSSDVALAVVYDNAFAYVLQLTYRSNGTVVVIDKSGSYQSFLTAAQATAGTYFLFKFVVTNLSATAGAYTVRAYSSSGSQVGSAINVTTGNTGTTVLRGIDVGIHSAVALTADHDSVQTNDGATAEIPSIANTPPTVSAGADQRVNTGTTVTLPGTASDSDGTITTMTWTRVSGPANPTISSATSSPGTATATLNGSVTLATAGTYVYQLSATDSAGATTTDQATYVVVNPSNPTANATATGGYGIVDATTSLPAASGALTYSISPSTGTVQYATGKFLVPLSPTSTTVYTVTVAESGGGTSTVAVTAPASGALTPYTGTQLNVTLPTPLDPASNAVWGTQINTALTALQQGVNGVIGYYNNPS